MLLFKPSETLAISRSRENFGIKSIQIHFYTNMQRWVKTSIHRLLFEFCGHKQTEAGFLYIFRFRKLKNYLFYIVIKIDIDIKLK